MTSNFARLAGRGFDVVESRAEPADDGEPRRRLEQRRIDPGAVADNQRIGIAEPAEQIGAMLGQRRLVAHAAAGAQRIDDRLVHECADEPLHAASRCVSRAGLPPPRTLRAQP